MLGSVISALTDLGSEPFVGTGPLLDDLASAGVTLADYRERGGYELVRSARDRPAEALTDLLEEAGLRGRGGGSFPTGYKWALVRGGEAEERCFVCNAHASPPRGFKEAILLGRSPHRVIEAMLLALHCVGARRGFLFVGKSMKAEEVLLKTSLEDARAEGLLEGVEIEVVRSTGGYVTGEETALIDVLEGGLGRPRVKPPMPAIRGFRNQPTAISNLETTLQVYRIVRDGAEAFRAEGTPFAPGTQIVSLSGAVRRPGLFEVGYDMTLGSLIDDCGQGVPDGELIRMVLPGGLATPALSSGALDTPLDPDALDALGSKAGLGPVVVVPETTDPVEFAIDLQRFFHAASCGKCQPCKDGTQRAVVLLENLDSIDQASIDHAHRHRPESPRKRGGLYVVKDDEILGGMNYTDTVEGLEKVRILTEFYRYRGDCGHPEAAALAIQRLLEMFPDDFDLRSETAEAQAATS